jgi:hypothetical protein
MGLIMYSCYLLSEKSRNLLLEKFPPKYKKVLCHHITVVFNVPMDAPLPKEATSIKIIGYIDSGDGLECFLTNVDGETIRPDGKIFHITHSLDSELGYKPVDSNILVKEADKIVHFTPITITAIPSVL